MSMVSVKTIEIAGVKVPDLSKCKDIFEKYSKFYKEEDALEILGAIARNIEVVKLFLESVKCQLNGQKLSGIIGKVFSSPNVPPFEKQQKLVSIYALMLEHLSDGKGDFVRECIKVSIENGLIMLIIRVFEDTNADKNLLIYVDKYEESHSKEISEFEAIQDKVYRRQVLETDGAIREIVDNAIGQKPLPDSKEFFKEEPGMVFEQRFFRALKYQIDN